MKSFLFRHSAFCCCFLPFPRRVLRRKRILFPRAAMWALAPPVLHYNFTYLTLLLHKPELNRLLLPPPLLTSRLHRVAGSLAQGFWLAAVTLAFMTATSGLPGCSLIPPATLALARLAQTESLKSRVAVVRQITQPVLPAIYASAMVRLSILNSAM